MLLSELSFGRSIHRIYAGYSWDIHGIYVCIGYVSGMYRVCVGKALKDTRSEKGSRDTERGEITISYAQSARNLNYLNYKRSFVYNNNNNIYKQHIALATTQRALRGIGRPLNCTERHGNQKDLVSLRKRRNNRSTKGR